MFDDIKDAVLAVAAIVVIFGVIAIIVGIIMNPEKLGREGSACRTSLLAFNRLTELSENTIKLKPQCPIIQKEIPLHNDYFEGKKLNQLTDEEYERAITRDFVELSANAWWISGEGDISEATFDKIKQHFSSENKCMVVYAVKMRNPRGVGDSTKKSVLITKHEMDLAAGEYTTKEFWGALSPKEQYIRDYYLEGYDAGVGTLVVGEKDIQGNVNKFDDLALTHEREGTEAIYGIAVGFNQVSSIKSWFISAFSWFTDGNDQKINDDSRYILIAPFDEIKKYCGVQNE